MPTYFLGFIIDISVESRLYYGVLLGVRCWCISLHRLLSAASLLHKTRCSLQHQGPRTPLPRPIRRLVGNLIDHPNSLPDPPSDMGPIAQASIPDPSTQSAIRSSFDPPTRHSPDHLIFPHAFDDSCGQSSDRVITRISIIRLCGRLTIRILLFCDVLCRWTLPVKDIRLSLRASTADLILPFISFYHLSHFSYSLQVGGSEPLTICVQLPYMMFRVSI